MNGQFRLLPILIFVSLLAFSVRLASVVTGVSHLSSVAMAEEKKEDEAATQDMPAEKKVAPDKYGSAAGQADAQATVGGAQNNATTDGEDTTPYYFEDETAKTPDWRDAGDVDVDTSNVRMELFDDLAKRSKQIEEADKNLKVREALLKAATQELDRKYQELFKLRKEIEGLLEKQSEEEDARIASLVKIYEGMKPQDAARIFDTLDLGVLVSVISRMSERKIAPIMAAMNAERARTVTIMLAEQKKLPELPNL